MIFLTLFGIMLSPPNEVTLLRLLHKMESTPIIVNGKVIKDHEDLPSQSIKIPR